MHRDKRQTDAQLRVNVDSLDTCRRAVPQNYDRAIVCVSAGSPLTVRMCSRTLERCLKPQLAPSPEHTGCNCTTALIVAMVIKWWTDGQSIQCGHLGQRDDSYSGEMVRYNGCAWLHTTQNGVQFKIINYFWTFPVSISDWDWLGAAEMLDSVPAGNGGTTVS